RGVATGFKFTLKGHPRSDQNRAYLIIGTSLQATAGAFGSGDGAGDFFSCNFTSIPATQQFRTPRATPKPLVRGPQTAIVTGPSGQEINTDEYGRVSVQFHWDRPSEDGTTQNANTSCMIRVAQVWAGKEWGSIYIPRIGQEVIVEFMEGDPDRPIITGSVYNADQMPPYALPANQTQSGVISRSSTGGGAANFNSLWFEDKKGSEQVSVQAEKDMVINIKNNRTETIGKDRSETVSGGHTETISKDRSLTVSGKETKEVDGDVTDTFKGALSQTVTNDVTHTFNSGLTVKVTNDVAQTYSAGLTLKVTNDVTETFSAGHTEQTTKAYSLQADTVAITGQTKITLTVGGNSITIDSSGITINSAGTAKLSATGATSIGGASIAIGS
ncbi:MAG TPA: type VI secretion system tip protein TssI/VgrG, partial [Verrucomicrobiae bacterium]